MAEAAGLLASLAEAEASEAEASEVAALEVVAGEEEGTQAVTMAA
jgi:hypothetical protein